VGFWKVFVEIFPSFSIVIVISRKLTDEERPLEVPFSWEYEFRS
jgi:hypothetical protein